MGPFVGTLGTGMASGVVSDALGAVPVTEHGKNSPTLVDGTVVTPSDRTARQHVFGSAAIVIAAAAIVLCGGRVLKNARIA